MNILDKNYRYEKKYLLNPINAQFLKYKLSLILKKDTHYNGVYYIRSLYFDDLYNTSYHEKVDGIKERSKYRIRIYNLDSSYISLELKGKNNDVSYKERNLISREEFFDLINGNYDTIDINNRSVLKDFIYKRKNNLIPAVVVDYKRLAFIYEVEDVRITFDEDIKSGMFNYDLFDENMNLFDVLESNEVILEVKYNTRFPSMLKKILKGTSMIEISSSKYALCMERKGIDL